MTSFHLYPLINHGNVLPVSRSARASLAGAVHAMTLSLAALRKLSFPRAPGEPSDAAADLAAQTALVALALVAMTGRLETGYHLRSGCDLIPRQPPQLECLGPSLAEITPLPLDRAAATALLVEAVAALRQQDLPWGPEAPITLRPSPQLIGLIGGAQAAEEAVPERLDDVS